MGRTIRSAVLHLKKAGDEPLGRVTVSSVGAEWFEGTGSGYAVQPGGATFRHRRHPDLALVDRRWRPLPRGPGQRRHDLADGRRLAARSATAGSTCRSTRRSWRPAWPASATVSSCSTTPARSGREPARSSPSGSSPIDLSTAATRTERVRPISRSSSGPDDRRPPAAPSGLRVEPATALLPAGEALVSWVTPRDDGPAGTLGFFVTLDGRALPRELIPLAGVPGERVEMHLRDLKLAAGTTIKLVGAGRRRGRQSRAGGDGRHHGLEPRPDPPARAQAAAGLRCPTATVAALATGRRYARSPSSTSWTRSTRSPAN